MKSSAGRYYILLQSTVISPGSATKSGINLNDMHPERDPLSGKRWKGPVMEDEIGQAR